MIIKCLEKQDFFSIENKDITIVELIVGFDKEFAERIKNVWNDSQLAENFQCDLNHLNQRYNFSLYIEGAKKNPDGLRSAIIEHVGCTALILGFGVLFTSVGMHDPTHRKAGFAILVGAMGLAAGAVLPCAIFDNYVSKARTFHIEEIIEKNLGQRISRCDRERLNYALEWAWRKGVTFDLHNENHLRGKYETQKTWWGGTRYV